MTTQQTIDDANNRVASAQAAYDAAVTDQASKYARMSDWYNLVTQCNVIGRGLGNLIDRNGCGHKNSGPCQSVSTCKSDVDTYNGAATDYHTASDTVTSKKTLLDNAISYRDTVLKNAQSDPTFVAAQNKAAADADLQKRKNRNSIIALTIIVVVVVIAIVIWKKL